MTSSSKNKMRLAFAEITQGRNVTIEERLLFEAGFMAGYKTAIESAENQPTGVIAAPSNKTHKYKPHKKYPWFCANCGYAKHELLMHDKEEL